MATCTESAVFLRFDQITIDMAVHARAALDEATVEEYRDASIEGAEFPPLDVFVDGETYWLSDGFTRAAGLQDAGKTGYACNLIHGGRREAILHAIKSNCKHGLRLTNADKRRNVATFLADEEWSARSDRWIAREAGVSHRFVSLERRQVATVATSNEPACRQGQDGKSYPTERKPQADPERAESQEWSPPEQEWDPLEDVDEPESVAPPARPSEPNTIGEAMAAVDAMLCPLIEPGGFMAEAIKDHLWVKWLGGRAR